MDMKFKQAEIDMKNPHTSKDKNLISIWYSLMKMIIDLQTNDRMLKPHLILSHTCVQEYPALPTLAKKNKIKGNSIMSPG